ncbi:MAG: TonB family protein [Pseudomonadota bacterium]
MLIKPWQIATLAMAAGLAGSTPALAQDGWVSPLPAGSRTATNDEGRFVRCLPPPGMGKTSEFDAKCRQFLDANRLVRVARPISKADWITAADFPAGARASGTAGSSTLRIHIDADATVTGCEIVRSSGNAALDAAACEATLRKARFHPRLDRNGRPIASDYTRNVNWPAY